MNEELEAQKVAVLVSQGALQESIAEQLRVSQATVSRLVKRARQEGWLEKHPRCSLAPERIRELEILIFGRGETLKKHLDELQKIPEAELLQQRYQKYRKIGFFANGSGASP